MLAVRSCRLHGGCSTAALPPLVARAWLELLVISGPELSSVSISGDRNIHQLFDKTRQFHTAHSHCLFSCLVGKSAHVGASRVESRADVSARKAMLPGVEPAGFDDDESELLSVHAQPAAPRQRVRARGGERVLKEDDVPQQPAAAITMYAQNYHLISEAWMRKFFQKFPSEKSPSAGSTAGKAKKKARLDELAKQQGFTVPPDDGNAAPPLPALGLWADSLPTLSTLGLARTVQSPNFAPNSPMAVPFSAQHAASTEASLAESAEASMAMPMRQTPLPMAVSFSAPHAASTEASLAESAEASMAMAMPMRQTPLPMAVPFSAPHAVSTEASLAEPAEPAEASMAMPMAVPMAVPGPAPMFDAMGGTLFSPSFNVPLSFNPILPPAAISSNALASMPATRGQAPAAVRGGRARGRGGTQGTAGMAAAGQEEIRMRTNTMNEGLRLLLILQKDDVRPETDTYLFGNHEGANQLSAKLLGGLFRAASKAHAWAIRADFNPTNPFTDTYCARLASNQPACQHVTTQCTSMPASHHPVH